jgi:hypothetical protein
VQLAPAWAAEFGGKTLDINGTSYYHYQFHINRKDVVQVAVVKLKAQVRACCRPGYCVGLPALALRHAYAGGQRWGRAVRSPPVEHSPGWPQANLSRWLILQ